MKKKDRKSTRSVLKNASLLLFSFVFMVLIFALVPYSIYAHLQSVLSESKTIEIPIFNNIFIFSLLFGFAHAVLIFCVSTSKTEFGSRVFLFLKGHIYHFFLIILMIHLCIMSITTEVSYSSESLNNLLSVEWTIFGLSLTIYLVWNVLIVNYLRTITPKFTDNHLSANIHADTRLALQKERFLDKIEKTQLSVITLPINLAFILLSSILVYFDQLSEELFTQNMVRCTFTLSVLTIILLFVDILKPTRKELKELHEENDTMFKNDTPTTNQNELLTKDKE